MGVNMYGTTEPDVDRLEWWADTLLVRPNNFMAWSDFGQYDTAAPVAHRARNADDILTDSNYAVMLRELLTVDENDDTDTVHDLGESHWAFGPMDALYVDVWSGPDSEERALWCSPQPDTELHLYSPAFRLAVSMLEALADYPILDEGDYSEREWEAWESTVADAFDSAARTHRDVDTPEFEQGVWDVLTGYGPQGRTRDPIDPFSHGDSHPDSVDWEAVQTAYDAARDELLEEYAALYVGAWPGQLALWP